MNTENTIKKQIKNPDFQEVIKLLTEYKYCLIYKISEVILDQMIQISESDWEEIQEAWFFKEEGQIHIYRDEGMLLAAMIDDALLPDAHTLEKTYCLADKFQEKGKKKITVKEYIDFDKEGQCYVAYTRLLRLT